jgi:carboxymethylenebutenolidase
MTLREPETLTLATPTGPMACLLYRPSGEGLFPGLLFYSEIFQNTGPIRRAAAHLAGHGYLVLVPEVYHDYLPAGTVLPYDAAGAETGNRLKITKPVAAFDADARAALAALRSHPACSGRLGVFGPCLGGHLAYRAALNPEVAAAACLYPTDLPQASLGAGKADDSLARAAELKGELLLIFGRQDPHVSAEGRAAIYQALTRAGVNFTWHEFNAAHAFVRDEGPRHDPALSRQVFDLVLELFARRLRA